MGKSMLTDYFTRFFVIFALATLTACSGGGDATTSPDLPAPSFSDLKVSCVDTISVGQTERCTATCDVISVNSDGQQMTQDDVACPGDKIWSDGCDELTVDNQGNITGVAPGVCNVRVKVGDEISPDEPVTIVAVTVNCSIIYVAGAETDPRPDATCSNNNANRALDVPPGARVPLRVAAKLSDGSVCYAPSAPAGETTCAAGVIDFFSSNEGVGSFEAPPNQGTVRAVDVGAAVLTGSGTVNQVNMTVSESQLETTLCVEPTAPQLPLCEPYDQATVVCNATQAPNIAVGGTKQFRARAYFDVSDGDPDTGQVCDVTAATGITWEIDDVGDNAAANPTVDATGLVSAGDVATALASVRATYQPDVIVATGEHDFNVVDNIVLAANSVIATANPLDRDNINPTRAACMGSYDLVGGLADSTELPAERGYYAVTRKCLLSAVDGTTGQCPDEAFDNSTLDDVTNAAGNQQASEADGTISWSVEPGYWDGSQCVQGTTPLGGEEEPNSLFLGNKEAGLRYIDDAAFENEGADARQFVFDPEDPDSIEDNGQAETVGPVRLATNCLVASYTATDNVTGNSVTSRDGITVLVLPATNDSVLSDPSNDPGFVELCNTLVPLFSLGASPGGSNGAVIQAVASVASLLNTLVVQLDENIPVNDIVTQLVGALEPITGPLSVSLLTPILEAVNGGVYTPLNCLIGEILKGVATQDPAQVDVQACAPGGDFPGGGDGTNPLEGTPLEALADALAALFGALQAP